MGNIFIGSSDNKAHKMKSCFIGVDGIAKQVKAIYLGVNGIAKLVWSAIQGKFKKMGAITLNDTIYNVRSSEYSYFNSSPKMFCHKIKDNDFIINYQTTRYSSYSDYYVSDNNFYIKTDDDGNIINFITAQYGSSAAAYINGKYYFGNSYDNGSERKYYLIASNNLETYSGNKIDIDTLSVYYNSPYSYFENACKIDGNTFGALYRYVHPDNDYESRHRYFLYIIKDDQKYSYIYLGASNPNTTGNIMYINDKTLLFILPGTLTILKISDDYKSCTQKSFTLPEQYSYRLRKYLLIDNNLIVCTDDSSLNKLTFLPIKIDYDNQTISTGTTKTISFYALNYDCIYTKGNTIIGSYSSNQYNYYMKTMVCMGYNSDSNTFDEPIYSSNNEVFTSGRQISGFLPIKDDIKNNKLIYTELIINATDDPYSDVGYNIEYKCKFGTVELLE